MELESDEKPLSIIDNSNNDFLIEKEMIIDDVIDNKNLDKEYTEEIDKIFSKEFEECEKISQKDFNSINNENLEKVSLKEDKENYKAIETESKSENIIEESKKVDKKIKNKSKKNLFKYLFKEVKKNH
ncbi:MAG: hypothetical protein Q8885_00165 [Candidatus Phytoplasma stylosanthis]|nr:hypothetical protein [Candidatus Phytoplasma stylosanthis]